MPINRNSKQSNKQTMLIN